MASLKVLILVLLILASPLLSHAGTKSNSENMPPIIDTGIVGTAVCWYDNERLVVMKRSPFKAGPQTDFEGLFFISPDNPRQLNMIDLSPIELNVQKHIWDISCQDGSIVFTVPTPDKTASRLYSLKIGGMPELIVEMRGALTQFLSTKGKYVLSSTKRKTPATREGNSDCPASFVKPTFRILCLEGGFLRRWALTNFILSEYGWSNTLTVLGEDGKPKAILNPEKQLTDKRGKPLNYALFQHDLDGVTRSRLNDDPVFKPSVSVEFYANSEETYLYSPCRRLGSSYGSDDGVCRYGLDGTERLWEEVFRFDEPRTLKGGIQRVKVSENGDAYFVVAGVRAPHHGIWKFSSSTKKITHVTQPGHFDDVVTAISPDSKWVAVSRTSPDGNKLILLPGGSQ